MSTTREVEWFFFFFFGGVNQLANYFPGVRQSRFSAPSLSTSSSGSLLKLGNHAQVLLLLFEALKLYVF